MLGSSVSTLDVLLQTNSSPETVVWSRRGTQNAVWLDAHITVRMKGSYRVQFAGKRNRLGQGFIAIDDITMRAGVCTYHGTCGFESPSVCGYEQDVTETADWAHTNGLDYGPQIDQTYRTKHGHFMTVLGEDTRKVAHLLTPEYPSTMESCVQFWYWLTTDHNDSFSIHTMENGELGEALWALSGAKSHYWEVAQVTVSTATHFKVVFKAQLDPAAGSFVAIDEVTLTAGACPHTGSCDFESSQCTWLNSQGDQFDWIHANDQLSIVGPSVDHTTQTADGKINV
uniref:MAM domain-containing protein n=1 Tax=Lepisosteus oculatus TaxID=7918 RepID=W5MY26_LEPOC